MALPADPANAGWWQLRLGPVLDQRAPPSSRRTSTRSGTASARSRTWSTCRSARAVTVTGADGTATRYAVATVDLLAKTGVPWASIFDHDGPRRLVLVTCGGEFDTATHHYRSNLVVTATPL